ncbi:hypothetical protein CLV68_3434 [Actinokineospora cianjurensis]|uniref:Uncharacterized protein n=2 Tax=Actinokineospora cianjurensis TaxID=585224 RepID=A0A421B3U9_9PSEU|nr:hypothetical protein CLV68_3434 [Actinokineospora cianjurensis]
MVAAPTHNEHSGSASTVVQVGNVAGGVHLYSGEALAPDHSAWLRSAWAYLAGAVMEMRYVARAGRVEGFLVVRAEGADRDEVEQQVVRLRVCLGTMPGQVISVPVRDEARTREVLAPFEPRGGVVEVRKRLTAHRTSRDDASSPWLAAVTPFTYRRQPWEPLWSAMAGLPFRTMLSVGLAPFTIGPGLRSHLAARATEFSRLAQVGPPPTGVWSAYRPPDEFAAAALPLVADAVRRYTDQAFLTRVSLAGEQPVPSVLAELAANTVSPPERNAGFVGASPKVETLDHADTATAWHNLTTLNFAPLSTYAQEHPPGAIGEVERVLVSITDIDEAAAVFRLPYKSTATASLFAEPV